MIILQFVFFFGVMLLVLGCGGSKDDDPNARYIGIASEGDCAKQAGYWYNSECWSNVIDNDGSLAPDEVATYIDSYLQAKSRAEVRINGKAYKPFAFDMLLRQKIIGGGNSTLSIEGNKAYLNGDLGAEAYIQIRGLQEHPEVKTLVLQRVPGSINDEINMHTGRLVRALGLITYLPSDGEAYSGGVDLFAAGVERIVEGGGKLGIHAWCCVGDVPVDELVDTHPAHRFQIEYFTEVMGEKLGPLFYFRTIKAAPADGMYIMTEDEMIQSGIATKIIDPPTHQ